MSPPNAQWHAYRLEPLVDRQRANSVLRREGIRQRLDLGYVAFGWYTCDAWLPRLFMSDRVVRLPLLHDTVRDAWAVAEVSSDLLTRGSPDGPTYEPRDFVQPSEVDIHRQLILQLAKRYSVMRTPRLAVQSVGELYVPYWMTSDGMAVDAIDGSFIDVPLVLRHAPPDIRLAGRL